MLDILTYFRPYPALSAEGNSPICQFRVHIGSLMTDNYYLFDNNAAIMLPGGHLIPEKGTSQENNVYLLVQKADRLIATIICKSMPAPSYVSIDILII